MMTARRIPITSMIIFIGNAALMMNANTAKITPIKTAMIIER